MITVTVLNQLVIATLRFLSGATLHHLAEEVVELIKDQCGKEVFSVAHTAVHQQAAAVRTKRRTERALQVMHRLLV